MRLRFALWCLVVAAVIVTGGVRFWRGPGFETSVLALLPEGERDPVVEEAARAFTDTVSRRLVFLVAHRDAERAVALATALADELEQLPDLENIFVRIDERDERALFDLYFPHRHGILGDGIHAALHAADGGAQLARRAVKILHSPLSAMVSEHLEGDPLLLFPALLENLPRPGGAIELRDGHLVVAAGGVLYVLVAAEVAGDVFSRSLQARLALALEAARERIESTAGAEVLSTGVLRFAAAGASAAERDVSTIGTGSILGVLLVTLLVFRSLRPLVLGLLPIAVGIAMALSVTLLAFPRVHLITLGFGASLIGVCVDYSFHFFADQLAGGPRWTSRAALARILPGITLGAVTSIIAYLGLLVAPFPGLKQMAVFSASGLGGAFGTVVCWFPLLCGKAVGRREVFLARLASGWIDLWRARRAVRWTTVGLIVVAAASGVPRIEAVDDVRLLQTMPEGLVAEDAALRRLAGRVDGGRFLLVEGDTEDDLLARERALSRELESLRARGALDAFACVSRFVPPVAEYVANRELLRRTFLGPERLLERHMDGLGFSEEAVAALVEELGAEDREPLGVADWLASPVSAPLRHLWIGPTPRGFASIVSLDGVADEAALAGLERHPRVHYVDRVAEISALLRACREATMALVALAYALIFVLLVARHGWRRGLAITAAPMLAAAATVAAVAWSGRPLDLFTTLGLLLVLGIGIDYTIFLAEHERRAARAATAASATTATSAAETAPTLLAIILSALTTLLSFGLLALSAIPFLSSFGLTVLVGIALAVLLAPLALAPSRPGSSGDDLPGVHATPGEEPGRPGRDAAQEPARP